MHFVKEPVLKDLVKNPIGIIALFISMIYAFANLLLGVTASSLTPNERYPLIIFIIIFPIIVLTVFYLLVSRHHGKLYAPGDYQDDRSFLRTLSPEERELKLATEAEEALPTTIPVEATPIVKAETQRSNTQKMDDIRNEIRQIESSVIAKFENELNLRAEHQVAVGETGASFDALFQTGEKLTFLEVKSIRSPLMMSMTLDRVLYNAVVADRFMNSNFKLILAVVYSFDTADLARIENIWRKRIEKCPATIDLRFIKKDSL